jgi:hypothetical protein
MTRTIAKPTYELLAAALILFALVACLHREVLFAGSIYHMDDAADNYYPARVAFRRALAEGTLPSWEKNAMGGWPLLSDPYYGYFYPLNFVFYLGTRKGEPPSGLAGGVAAGLGLSAALHAFVAGVGMYLYLRGRRGRRLSFLAALLGGISFALSSFLVVRIRHIIYVQMMAWVPFLLAAIDAYIETRSRKALFACALFTGLLLLCGAHSLVHFVALVVVAYTLAALLSTAGAKNPRPVALAGAVQRLRWLFGTTSLLAVAALCGVLIAAVAILPTLLALPHSARALGTDYAFASSYAWPNWSYYRLLFYPNMFGIGEWNGSPVPWRAGLWNHWELAGYYQGKLPLLLAVPGAILPRLFKNPDRRFLTHRLVLLVLLSLCMLGILIALGDAGPVHPFLFKHLPLYGALRCPARALCMLVIAVPILGAHAADTLAGYLPGRWLGPLFLSALCGLTAADEYSIGRTYVQPRPRDFAYGTEHFAAMEWLQHEMKPEGSAGLKLPVEPYRFVPDGRGPFRLLSAGETMDLESASGYSSMLVWRYVHLLYILNQGRPYPFTQLRYDPAAAQFLRLDSPLIDMLNVRYLVASNAPSSKWLERFRPQPGAPPQARYEAAWDSYLRVYENTQVMPRAYVAYQARLASSQAEEAALLARRDFNPHREIVLGPLGKATALAQPPAVENRGRAHGPAQVLLEQRHHVVIEAEAVAPGLLVLADTFFPGWVAKVDGNEQPIWPVNLAQRGVALPPGHHHIEFSYHDRALLYGGGLSLLGLLGLLGLLRGKGREKSAARDEDAASSA